MSAPPTPRRRDADTFTLSRRLFSHGLGLVFLTAFWSLAVQVRGLLGTHGISPASDFLGRAHARLGVAAYFELPTVFWLQSSDAMLTGACLAGIALSLVLAAGFLPGPCTLLLWALYLSLNVVGSPFLNFQWDALLLETGLLAALFLPWHLRPRWGENPPVATLGRCLLWWLIFRLMAESGIVKLASGDPTWRNLSAMSYHYETQPLPLWTAWFAHHAPLWLHRLEALATFAVEFLAPLTILAPRRLRQLGAWAVIALQVGILSTGNFAFFNALTILLCLPLLDDAHWPARWRQPLAATAVPPSPFSPWPLRLVAPAAALTVLLTGLQLLSTFARFPWPPPLAALHDTLAPLRSFNRYGLFAVMTTTRPEIIVEGSNDGRDWQAYGFRWKPGDVSERPRLAAPHQPRLDWQMWFAALDHYEENPWFIQFLGRLLEGSPEVLALLEWNPFPDHPPRYIHALLYDYHFTRPGEGSAWWRRELKGPYCPPLTRRETPL